MKQLHFKGQKSEWFSPISLEEVLQLKSAHPTAKMVVGNSELGVEARLLRSKFPTLIYTSHVPEMTKINISENKIEVGASVPLTDIISSFTDVIAKEKPHRVGILSSILVQLERFASRQIRNVACMGGSLCTGSPTSDIGPIIIASNAVMKVQSISGTRDILASEWFVGYRRTALKPDEVLLSISFPFTKELEFVQVYKQSRRREDDISIVSACFRVVLEKAGTTTPVMPLQQPTKAKEWVQRIFSEEEKSSDISFSASLPSGFCGNDGNLFLIKECCFAFGSMSVTSKKAEKTSAFAVGKPWSPSELLPEFEKLLRSEDFNLPRNVPGGQAEYRRTMSTCFIFKFLLEVNAKLYGEKSISPELLSVIQHYQRPLTTSSQDYEEKEAVFSSCVGSTVTHLSAKTHVTGESIFTDDVKVFDGLHAAFISSTKSYAKILSMDTSRAMEMPGVVAIYTAKDIPGINKFGIAGMMDEEVFATEYALCYGYPLGVVVADTHEHAVDASKVVQVSYEVLEPILTIQDAIAKKSYVNSQPLVISSGNVDEAFKNVDHIVEGDMMIGGQEHFYMEPMACITIPGEDGALDITCTSQNPAKTQHLVATTLGLPANKVNVIVRRVGGAFGGKESRNVFVALACCVPAFKLQKPVRLVMDRDLDMAVTGTRHPFYAKYKAGFNNDGKVIVSDTTLWSNGGYSSDLSIAVLQRALFHLDSSYHIPNMRCTGYVCKTNRASNTAFRGFGGPQGMLVAETMLEQIAIKLGMDQRKIREINFYKEAELTHYGMPTTENSLPRVWDECQKFCEVDKRKQEILEFNKTHRFLKRGMWVAPLKFGLAFTQSFLNQAGALVHVYQDGSVLVTHGGCEIGQGLHTKMAQIAATELRIPVSYIRIGDTATEKVANTSPTAASAQCDLNGMAVLDASKQIRGRIDEFMKKYPDSDKWTWEETCKKAYFGMVDLGAHGFYKANVGYDFATGKGRPFSYFTFGACFIEVEVNTLTGDHTILLSDVVMDIGKSINPAIDVGQIEGAFVQGLGWATLEEIVVTKNGVPLTLGPGRYKVPGFTDIPIDFRVRLLRDAENPYAIHSSKGLGEPPLFLGTTVYYAIKEAISAARKDQGIDGFFNLPFPATCEVIRMFCRDGFTDPSSAVPVYPGAPAGEVRPAWAVEDFPTPDRIKKM
eukprot:TRINITY_DN6011_c0_g1_i1.p1 TRINITY_DN6011_c0_g1~~TRINITY_DN6011_c0_g1_i1.p1  ORF type:complete len:1367 (+),score=357.63 TRINITY_DN6011_c0_g1_i1:595-4101(+)